MPFKISVDKGKCIGCQNCANVCPAMFRMNGDKAQPIKSKVDDAKCAGKAASECPVQAITVKEG
jgi:ferredoxin